MGRQAYMTRLALGRSAFDLPEWPEPPSDGEARIHANNASSHPVDSARDQTSSGYVGYIQHYDVRGHPENSASRSAARRSRRAQNDVLATVGVCVNVDKNGKLVSASGIDLSFEKTRLKKLHEIASENLVGIWLRVVDNFVHASSTFFVESLRERLLTFNIYSGIPLKVLCQIEWKHFGGLKFLYAGLPAMITFQILRTARDIAIDSLYELALERYVLQIKSRGRQRWSKRLLDWTKLIFEGTTFLFIVPMQLFSTLQQLDLIPAWPLLPNPNSLSVSSLSHILFPPLPTQWTMRSFLGFVASFSLSPMVLFSASECLANVQDNKIARYAFITMPRPDNPDTYSTKGSPDYNDNSNRSPITGKLATAKSSGNSSLISEIKKDLDSFINTLVKFGVNCKSRFSTAINTRGKSDEQIPPASSFESSFIEQLSDDERNTNQFTVPAGIAALPPEAAEETSSRQNESIPITTSNSSTTTPSLPSSESDNEDPGTPEPPNNAVQITTRTGSTDTLHMNVEFNASVPGVPVYTSSFSASPRSALVETVVTQKVGEARRHRVTLLNTYGANALCEHLGQTLGFLIRVPLDALYLRSVALGFLAATATAGASPRAQAAASRLRANVYPMNAWFGTGMGMGLGPTAGRTAVGDYVGKIVLCAGLETVIGFGVWQVGMGVAWWFGKRWFHWGQL